MAARPFLSKTHVIAGIFGGRRAVGAGCREDGGDNAPPSRAGLLFLLPVACLLLVSCRSMPTPTTAASPAALPDCYTARQTVVFEFRPHWWWPTIRLTALGYTSVNRTADEFAVACLTPLGVKLFDVARTNGQTQARVMLPVPGNSEQMAQAIDDDIAALYLDLTPPPGAKTSQHGDRLTFRREQDGQVVEWTYAASTGRLLRKTTTSQGVRRELTFNDYHRVEGIAYPATLTLDNRRYRYRFTVRIQGLQPAP